MSQRCPLHGYQDWFQIQLFYIGLNDQKRKIVDAAAKCILLSKTANEANPLLEKMSTNNCQLPDERSIAKKTAGIHEVDPIVSLLAQVSTLANQIATFTT